MLLLCNAHKHDGLEIFILKSIVSTFCLIWWHWISDAYVQWSNSMRSSFWLDDFHVHFFLPTIPMNKLNTVTWNTDWWIYMHVSNKMRVRTCSVHLVNSGTYCISKQSIWNSKPQVIERAMEFSFLFKLHSRYEKNSAVIMYVFESNCHFNGDLAWNSVRANFKIRARRDSFQPTRFPIRN